MIVLFLISKILFIISSAVFSSKELVASSNISISLSLYNALAIPILCICPPDKFFTVSLSKILFLFSSFSNSSNLEKLIA